MSPLCRRFVHSRLTKHHWSATQPLSSKTLQSLRLLAPALMTIPNRFWLYDCVHGGTEPTNLIHIDQRTRSPSLAEGPLTCALLLLFSALWMLLNG